MNFSKCVVFEISAEYGHFRKFTTTTSPLTYSIPTPTAIAGFIGAILGLERIQHKSKSLDGMGLFNDNRELCRCAIQILNPVSKTHIGFNLLDTSKSPSSFFNIKNRTQIEFELLKNPRFRIFLAASDIIIDELASRLRDKSYHFNPYLGLSQFTANTSFEGIADLLSIDNSDKINYITAINIEGENTKSDFLDISKLKNKQISLENMPLTLTRDRVVKEYGKILIEKQGETLSARSNSNSFNLKEYGNIMFL